MKAPTAAGPSAREIRKLGLVFLLASAALGALAAWKRAAAPEAWPWQAWVAAAFALAGLACLALGEKARPLHAAWTALGAAMGRVVSPIVFAILYYLVLTPFALASRPFRRRSMPLRPDRSEATYWRKPAEPKTSRARMLRQY